MNMNSWSIPEEIIFEIFSWLPVKSLMRFKCVTKSCNSLVSESDFVDIHKCRSMTRPDATKFFFREDGKISASLFQNERFDERYRDSSTRLDCVNGLFCVWGLSPLQPAAIFNPSTREVRFLPELNKHFVVLSYSLGFVSEEKRYKVLLSTYNVQQGSRNDWVLTLGIDRSWRETQNIFRSFPYFPYCKPSVCICGVIYRFIKKRAIAAFDVNSEKFKIIALWNASHLMNYYVLLEVKGKLAVIDYRVSGCFDLWILEQTPKREWQRHIIGFPSKWNNTPCFASHDGEIVVYVKGTSCLRYDVTRKSWRTLKIKGLTKKSCIKGIYSYAESLVPFG